MAFAMKTRISGSQIRAVRRPSVRPATAPVRGRQTKVAVKALFGFLSPKPAASGPKAAELVEDLVDITKATAGGARATPQAKEEIAELV